ncbi:hypothetical protein [Leptolyngbya sp. CCY15150]|uniref:hypothetical protein n=1 Tax=Leptolyngbya sp. CCY15150 TaxID=2767772 RepID=UPI00194E5121|nr:hypothetical protein [Leptolyngbya sp. CCY15150]
MVHHATDRCWLLGISFALSAGLAACGSTSAPSSSAVTTVAIPNDTEEVSQDDTSETPELTMRLTAPACEQLVKHWDNGDIEAALLLTDDLIATHEAIAAPVDVATQCSEVLGEATSMALVDVSVILDEQESAGSVSDRVLDRFTQGECWLLSGAYNTNALVGDIFKDDLATDNIVGQHCAGFLATDPNNPAITALLGAIAAETNLSSQDCWLLRGAYDAEIPQVKEAIGDSPLTNPSLQSSCTAEFKG